MLRKAVIAYGEEAARLLYEPDRMTRRRALPVTTLTLLQDFGSVELLDERPHRHRKAMFMSLMTPAALTELGDLVEREWQARIPEWEQAQDVVLFDAVREVLCRAVCAWSGIPLADDEVATRTRQFAAMVEGAGSAGPRNLRGQFLRHRAERWAGQVIERIRSGDLPVKEGRAARVIAAHRDEDGRLLGVEVARVELINVLRPTVAVARYVAFAALALHQHPDCRARVREDDEYLRWFVQEVRRYLLTTAMSYDVPLQDLSVDLSRMPAAPASGVRISRVRPA
ncbi:cytochrome P450 [Blastococcus saxobsidens]|uniref:Fatty acid alpha hydroxylase, cytochrome P450 n=1 Tax=Blastococcus saxobsidens (strain DD2) TaxID=1146883 RepID=H6RNA1_BLASD|nr:cytochrome P450 [Blastococcus saxobsidens]CCG02649.1 Fatty acid alpha hydroxylase, cytochrome P450 [Blastococcus saxobsidens DD2]